jgi:transcriptional regulator with XRE-family HTH domain
MSMGDSLDTFRRVGLRVKTLRKMQNLSQSDLGALCNLEKTAIQRIERGFNSTLATLEKLSNGFNISLSELLDIDNKYSSLKPVLEREFTIKKRNSSRHGYARVARHNQQHNARKVYQLEDGSRIVVEKDIKGQIINIVTKTNSPSR